MEFSSPSLHPPVISFAEHKTLVASVLLQKSRAAQLKVQFAAAPHRSLFFPLTTVSLASNFDSYIDVQFEGTPPGSVTQLLVDSGNSVLVVPRWEEIEEIADYSSKYTLLGAGTEPWGCPAKIVRGPISLTTITNDLFTIDNCIFYACTGDSPKTGTRTANFGTGCISPWTTSKWNVPQDIGVVMQSPLSYAAAYPYAEFNYAPASTVHAAGETPNVVAGSYLGLHMDVPVGFQMFDIIKNLMWMSLAAKSLSVGGRLTSWPGEIPSPIAMIDTGGTCVFLSDPNGCLYTKTWPHPTANPQWTATSQSCESIQDPIVVGIGDRAGTYTYAVDTSDMAATVQGLTLVMCQENAFMMEQDGMNIGGLSALMNGILVDYKNARVGFKSKALNSGAPSPAPADVSTAPPSLATKHEMFASNAATSSVDVRTSSVEHGTVTPVWDRVGRTIHDIRNFFIVFLFGNSIWLLTISGSVLFLSKGGGLAAFLLVLGKLGVLSGASLISGALFGFIFGIPRSLSSAAAAIAQNASITGDQGGNIRPNTNLEQISDWLTKILVGVGLTQITRLPSFLQGASDNFNIVLSPLTNGGVVALSIMAAFGFGGFVWAYFESRTSLMKVFGEDDGSQSSSPPRKATGNPE